MALPTFHILIATAGRRTLIHMLDSLKNQLNEEDAITIVFDGEGALAKSTLSNDWLNGHKSHITIIEQVPNLGFWGHGIRNKYQGNLTHKTTFIMNADDDDIYVNGAFDKLRIHCLNESTMYIAQMDNNNETLIPNILDKRIYIRNIGTPCGIIPFSIADKGSWGTIYGGDCEYYLNLQTFVDNINFLDILIYKVKPNIDFIINKYTFSEGIKYQSKTQSVTMEINNGNNITLSKLNDTPMIYSWFGYELNPGKYVISFDILSSIDITEPFIKLHNPVIFHKTDMIQANTLKSVSLTIRVKNANTLLNFIFDSLDKTAIIQFKNIRIEEVKLDLDFNVVVRGHFRTFQKTHGEFTSALSKCTHRIFMHTWNTIDADTKTWYNNDKCNINKLDKADIDLLHTFDKDVIIEAQEWTEEERNDLILSRPYKTFLYFWQGIHSGLQRITEESRFILICRYDIIMNNIDFSTISCEEDEIVIGYAQRYPNIVFPYGFTDLIFIINYKDKHKLLSIPQKILELQTNMDPRYKIAEDPITDFFYSNWKKVTPKWIRWRDIDVLRPTDS